MKKLKEKVLEAAKLAQECPEDFQKICFELLLKKALKDEDKGKGPPGAGAEGVDEIDQKEPTSALEKSAASQDDLTRTDVHLKVRRLLEKSGLTVENLNQLFYKEDNNILPLYDDLKTTRVSESQIRITLLQCLHEAIKSGDFKANLDAVRDEAVTRKCYDVKNWANNFNNNAHLFDFEKYSKKIKIVSLSETGKTELANLIKELQ